MSNGNPSKRRAAVFVCSLPEDPRFLDFLRRTHGDYLICALDFQALQTARRFVPSDKILDVMTLISPEDRERADFESTVVLNSFWQELLRHRSEPWLASLEFMNDGNPFFYIFLWKRVLERVDQLVHGGDVCFYGPFSRGAWPGSIVFAMDTLEAMVDEWRSRQARSQNCRSLMGLLKTILRRGLTRAGLLVNRFARMCATCSSSTVRAPSHANVLICGLQETDRLAQMELVRQILLKGLTGVRWLTLARGRLAVAADERPSDSEDKDLDTVRDQVESCGHYRWKHPWLESMSRRHVRQRFLDAIRLAAGSGFSDALCEGLADALERRHSFLRMRYLEVSELLQRYRPSLVIGSSVVDSMICVREWARHHSVPFIRFPHGVEYLYREALRWDAGGLCVFGEETRRGLLHAGTVTNDRISTVGGLHLAVQSRRGPFWSSKALSVQPWRCSMLVTYGFLNYPDAGSEIRLDVLGLAGAVNRQGGIFGIRLHPRQSDWDGPVYQAIEKDAVEAGIHLNFSDAQKSLMSELAASAFALIRVWGGAGIAALYAGVPIIGWIPRPGLPESADIVERLPLHASNVEEFEEIICRLKTDKMFLVNALQCQNELLEQLISDPWGDPWAKAVKVIASQMRGVNRAGGLSECGIEAEA